MKRPVLPGKPYPPGSTWDGHGVNFALFSAHAEKVELCLFDATGRYERERIELPEQTHYVWHVYLPDVAPGTLYGYRVYGPYEPERGHRFNHHKLLLDPYAKQLHGQFRWIEAHYGYRFGSQRQDLSFDKRDNARAMPKCQVVDPAFTWDGDQSPFVPWSQTVIYETHVRGFTMLHQGVPVAERGSFAAMGHHEIVAYLKALGITSVELMPVHAFVDDHFLVKKGLRNYWGYNTLNFFAPESRYMSRPELAEFKTMVRRLHDAGIEVLLDVVYNHTAEGNQMGPTLSFRGIDNASYYWLDQDDPRYYINDTGVGNTLNITHPHVLQLVMDSLRYWVTEMHVDGFRFDLAVTLGREKHGFDPHSGFFDIIQQDPVLSRVKLIAEPWDIGPGGYQLGGFPAGWAEWNDHFRDTVRRFWRGDKGVLPEVGRRMLGSSDLFESSGRKPWASINFVACHDGFTLTDTVSYNERHNEMNGEDNRDGHSENFSSNYGIEGAIDDRETTALRQRQRLNMLATVFFAQGTPMLLAGDEFGRSQQGNNNAYCQDNKINWIDWSTITGDESGFLEYVRYLISLRRNHPVLRRRHFLHGKQRSERTGLRNIEWLDPLGGEMDGERWHDSGVHCIGMLLTGDALEVADPQFPAEVDDTLLIILNAGDKDGSFKLPEIAGYNNERSYWSCLLNTALSSHPVDEKVVIMSREVVVRARSVCLLALCSADYST